ncbi:preprotein translocase subunit SecG [soil metagenome]
MQTVLLVVHLLIALALIGVVLMQRSEGGALGMGSGGAGSLFSSRGVGNALTRTTAFLALAFFVTSVALTLLATRSGSGGSIFDSIRPAQTQESAPPAQSGGTTGGVKLPDIGNTTTDPSKPQVPLSP